MVLLKNAKIAMSNFFDENI